MNSQNCVDFLNKVPGFYANEPTPGHVTIQSIYWVGPLIYYPKSGKYVTSGISSSDEVTSTLHGFASYQKPLSVLMVLKTVFTEEVLVEVIKSIAKCPPGM